jgi:hypothetical protein
MLCSAGRPTLALFAVRFRNVKEKARRNRKRPAPKYEGKTLSCDTGSPHELPNRQQLWMNFITEAGSSDWFGTNPLSGPQQSGMMPIPREIAATRVKAKANSGRKDQSPEFLSS